MKTGTKLDNQVALVTGSAVRIGATIVRQLHAEGAAVAVHYRRSAEQAEALVDELNAVRPDSARAFKADLASVAELEAMAKAVVAWRKRLDILVNNASSFYPTPIGTITEEHWEDLVSSNLKAPLFLSQAVTPALKEAGGCIVNIVDIHAQKPLKEHLVYGPAKAGLAMLTKSLAKELGPSIRVNGVSPGAILWPTDGLSESAKQSILSQVPLQRTGSPEDIARAVCFLVCDAPYVTGQIIAVDGGRTVGWS